MQNQKVMQTTRSKEIPGPVQLAAAILLYLILAMALILSYSIAEAAEPTYTVHRLYTRLATGEVISLPLDSYSAPSVCYGYNGMLTSRVRLEVTWQGTWYVVLPYGYDYAILCNGHVPTWVEDHDPGTWEDPAMLILDIETLTTLTVMIASPDDDRRAVGAIGCGPVAGYDYPGARVCVALPVNSEVFPELDYATWWGVNVPSWVTWWHVWWRE